MMNTHLAFLLFVSALGLFAVVALGLSARIGRSKAPSERCLPLEGDASDVGKGRGLLLVPFFLGGLLFLIMIAALMLLIPWAVAFREAVIEGRGAVLIVEIVLFVLILGGALLFMWREGALEGDGA